MQAEIGSYKIRMVRLMLGFSIMLMGIKFYAYWLTNSTAILTDALESIINVVAGAFALFSITISARPKDENHPYGHGKIEFLSAGFEGGLIFLAGGWIVSKAVMGFFHPVEIKSLDIGAIIAGIAGLCNYLMGSHLVRIGRKHNSILMVADGRHLISDTVSSIGLIAGLVIMYFTGMYWLDNVLAIAFGAIIFKTGYKLLRESITSLLDEADYENLEKMVSILSANRRPLWIDMHNLRALKYGPELHVDCHITLPWYATLEETHAEVKEVENMLKGNMNGEMEFSIHTDPCEPDSCPICSIQDCKVRKAPFVKTVEWSMATLLPDRKHQLE